MDWHQILENARKFRHALHQHPETQWEEINTAKLIRKHLDDANIPWRACAKLGTVATLAADAKGEHIALRGDIDALPILEKSGVSWCSKIDGKMHACGHDGHTATLMATAWWLKAHEQSLPGPVTLLFQPAEEGGHGAKAMIEDGALTGVKKVFGWHNWPIIPLGKAVCPNGPVMSANGTFHISITGVGGHSSQPEKCINPVEVASQTILELHKIPKEIGKKIDCVLSVTQISADSGETIIPETTNFSGSIRVANTKARDEVFTKIKEICEQVAQKFKARVDIELRPRYMATRNHDAEAKQYREALKQELGDGWLDEALQTPIRASEDFGYYTEEIPGAFALIGAGDAQHLHQVPCHSPYYDFNDKLIPIVVKIYAHLVQAPIPKD